MARQVNRVQRDGDASDARTRSDVVTSAAGRKRTVSRRTRCAA